MCSSDLGNSSSDNITNNTKPVITGIAPLSDATVTVVVTSSASVTYTYNNVAVSSGTWTLSLSSATVTSGTSFPGGGLPAGYTGLSVTGNTSATTASSSFLIDLTAPAEPTVTEQTTADATPTILGTATVGDGDTFTVLINGVTYTSGDGRLSVNTGAGTWSLVMPLALSSNSYTTTATITDAAGNSISANGNITISASTISIDLANNPTDDTGSSDTDNITSNREPVISGVAQSGDATVSVTLVSGGVTYTYGSVTVTSLAWSLDLSTATPASVSPTGN